MSTAILGSGAKFERHLRKEAIGGDNHNDDKLYLFLSEWHFRFNFRIWEWYRV